MFHQKKWATQFVFLVIMFGGNILGGATGVIHVSVEGAMVKMNMIISYLTPHVGKRSYQLLIKYTS